MRNRPTRRRSAIAQSRLPLGPAARDPRGNRACRDHARPVIASRAGAARVRRLKAGRVRRLARLPPQDLVAAARSTSERIPSPCSLICDNVSVIDQRWSTEPNNHSTRATSNTRPTQDPHKPSSKSWIRHPHVTPTANTSRSPRCPSGLPPGTCAMSAAQADDRTHTHGAPPHRAHPGEHEARRRAEQ
jgi:hypothetical protein